MKLNATQQQLLIALPKSDIQIIDETLRDTLIGDAKLYRAAIYALVKNKLVSKLNEADFCQSLSLNINTGRLPGYKITVGQYGGVQINNNANSTANKDYDNIIPTGIKKRSPKEKPEIVGDIPPNLIDKPYVSPLQPEQNKAISGSSRSRHVWIDRKLYRVTTTFTELEKLAVVVLRGKQETGGRITFNGKQYNCCDTEVFERYITVMMNAVPNGESDPVLDDGSGIPVELRIAS